MTSQPPSEPNPPRAAGLVGIAAQGLMIIGVAGFIVALFAFLDNNWQATGLALIASALALGQLLNALLRH